MDSYKVLNITSESSDKEIEIAYEDLKKKYDPSFNTSIYSYKKYRQILKAYENIKDEKSRKMYNLKRDFKDNHKKQKEYKLFDFSNVHKKDEKKDNYEDVLSLEEVKDVKEKTIDVSYLYYLLNLKTVVEYERLVRCHNCSSYEDCDVCGGAKVVEYNQELVVCKHCFGTGKVSKECKTCDGDGYYFSNKEVEVSVDASEILLKGEGDETYSGNGDLKIIFNFYDKENIKITGNLIEVKYLLNKEETLNGINKKYYDDLGSFRLEIPAFVEDGYSKEIIFNNTKIIFTFYNDVLHGSNIVKYLFINQNYMNKNVYFNDDYSECSHEKSDDFNNEVKVNDTVIIDGEGVKGLYGGANGNLMIKCIPVSIKGMVYTDNVECLSTSKVFNLLGGKINDIYHYGLKSKNALIERDGKYYFLDGVKEEKNKLRSYFMFKMVSLFIWFLIPCLCFIFPYNETFYFILFVSLLCYLVLINVLMEVEV